MTESTVIVLKENGDIEKVKIDHKKLHEFLCGDLTFVGGVDELRLFAVGRLTPPDAAMKNPWCCSETYFDIPVFGDVVMLYSDENGLAGDVDADAFACWLSNLDIQPL